MNTKTLIILFCFGIILTCCKSAKQLALEGKYDKAFNKAFNDVKKQSNNAESIELVNLSFKNANEDNLNRIYQLQERNSPDRWMEIAELYKSLQERQDKMRQILPFLPTDIQSSTQIYDYNNQLIDANNNAADYNFERGIDLLNMNSKSKARDAVNYFKQAKKYDPNDPEITRMIDEANFLGINHVLYVVNNGTPQLFPQEFMARMSQVANSYLNSSWVKYYNIPENEFNYDFIIELNFESINAVPERIDTKSSSYTKTVDDGWEYEYDRRGNVKKDANGNDIKRKKYKQIKCEVIVTTHTKSAFFNSHLNYIHNKSNSIVKSIPISLEQPYFYQFTTFKGDRSAVDSQVLAKLPKSEKSLPFPSVTDLVMMSQDKMTELVYAALKDNDKLIRNSD